MRKLVKDKKWLFISASVSLFLTILYLSIAPTRLTNVNFGGDGGDFLAAILTRGIPHPTGYPTYTLFGILFQYLPFSTHVFRGVLMSLIPAALAAGVLTGWMGYVAEPKSPVYYWAAALSGMAWGVSPLLFSQAVIVEVHGLQSLITVLFLWWTTLNLKPQSPTNKKWTFILSFLVGLGFGNHVMILLLVPVMIAVWIYLLLRTKSITILLAQLLFVVIGLSIYIYLPLRASTYPAINWGNPQTWPGFWWEVSGNPYRGLLFGVETGTLWERMRSVATLLADQFGILGLVAGVVGAVHYSFRIKWIRGILAWIFLIYLIFAIGYNTRDSVGYLIPAIMVFAIWVGLSLPALLTLHWRQIPIGTILIGILILSIVVRIPGNRMRLDPRGEDQPARYAEQLLKEAPANAIINTTTDEDTFPLWYYHFGLHERPDLRVVVLPLTQFRWYQQTLVNTYSDISFPLISGEDVIGDDWGRRINRLNPNRTVCRTEVSGEYEFGVGFECKSP